MALGLEDFKRSNVAVTIMVIALVFVLLFIPDILGIEAPVIDRASDFKFELPSLHGGRESSDDATESSKSSEETATRVALKTSKAEAVGPKRLVLKNGLSAATISSQKATLQLRELRSTSDQLARTLPARYQGTRFALLNLTGGLDRILQRDGGVAMSNKDKFHFVNKLDARVSAAMAGEGVPHDYAQVWQLVRLGGVESREEAESPEDPQAIEDHFFVSDLRYFRRPNRDGSYDPNAPLLVDAEFTIIGDRLPAVMSVQATVGNRPLKNLSLHAAAGEKTKKFYFTDLNSAMPHTFKLNYKKSTPLERRLSFRVQDDARRQFRYNRKKNYYEVRVPLSKGPRTAYRAVPLFASSKGNATPSAGFQNFFANRFRLMSRF